VPLVTIALIVTISAVSLISYSHPGVTEALERRQGALGHWQLWRVVLPLLVQTDGAGALAAVMALLAMVGLTAEPLLGSALFLAAFLVSGMAGHTVGSVWQPNDGGASVGVLGPLGVLLALLLRPRAPGRAGRSAAARDGARRIPLPGRVIGVEGLVAGVWLALIHDIHGPALLAGICTGAVLLVLDPGLTSRHSGAALFDRLAAIGPGGSAGEPRGTPDRTPDRTAERSGGRMEGPHDHR
jgi:membrane associated rhomboid family serine protease